MKNILKKDNVFILAEVAQSYEGSIEILAKIARRTCQAGVDGVMFQVVFADELAVRGYTHFDLFKSLEIPRTDWAHVVKVIHEEGKLALGEVFGKRSVNLMLDLNIDALKIHASDLSNIPLLKYIGSLKIPVLLSIGGAYETEIGEAIATLQENGTNELILLHGYQACPTDMEDTHLAKMKSLEEVFKLPVGYSDHIAGCEEGNFRRVNELAYYLPLVALGAGARLIEKHIILDRSKAWEDYESALSTDEFDRFVQLIRTYGKCMGKNNLLLNTSENNYRKAAKKHIVAAEKILEGNVITEGMITYKRIENKDNGIYNLHDVIGKKVKTDLNIDDPVTDSLLI